MIQTLLITRPTIDYIYNPDNQSKEQLIDSFVVRLKTFNRLFADIQSATMESPEQHFLIEGKRGMGKTTLLLRLGYAIENDTSLNTWLIPIIFNEEEYSIRKLYKLWERIAILLEEKDSQFFGLHAEMDSSYNNYETEQEYEYAIFNLLNDRLNQKGKKLVLFIDNFGDIFSKFNKQEIQRLRTVLQSNANFRFFGASSVVLEAFYDNKHPFFEFFKVIRLRGLNKKETNELLLKLGEAYKQEQIKEIIKNQQGRIEALRRLTGGVIRTIVLLFEIFIDQKQGSAFSDLEAILDRVTPLYKHRMDDLPAQQQEIVEAIAFAWDAINVSEISQKTRIPSKTVSAQLRQMEKNEIITKKLTNNKNHLYQISERFFNIWYLMRHGRKGDKRKVLWLVRFLEEWCDERELVSRTNQHIGYLKNGSYDVRGAYYLTEALAATKKLPKKNQDELIKVTRDFLGKRNSEFVRHLSESDLELLEKAQKSFDKNDFKNALYFIQKMKEKDNYRIGLCFDKTSNFIKAEEFYLKAIMDKKRNSDTTFNLGNLYATNLKNIEKAEKYYLQSVKIGNHKAMNNLAILYQYELKNFKKAKKFYIKAIENEDFKAMNNLAALYFEEKRKKEKALQLIERAHKQKDHLITKLNYAKILLWNNELTKGKEQALQFLYEEDILNKMSNSINQFLYLVLAKKQYPFLYDYFTNPKGKELNIKEKLKPIWYTLMYYMQDEQPNEYLRMGEELEETVKEIIEKVEQMRIDYA